MYTSERQQPALPEAAMLMRMLFRKTTKTVQWHENLVTKGDRK